MTEISFGHGLVGVFLKSQQTYVQLEILKEKQDVGTFYESADVSMTAVTLRFDNIDGLRVLQKALQTVENELERRKATEDTILHPLRMGA